MPEKVRAFERRSLVVHKGKVQAALVLLADDDPEVDEESDFDPDEEEEDEDEESDDEEDDEDEDDASLFAGTVLVPDERLSVR